MELNALSSRAAHAAGRGQDGSEFLHRHSPPPEIKLRDVPTLAAVLHTIRKRPVWPIALTLLGALSGLWVLHQQQKVFRSTASIIVTSAKDPHAHAADTANSRPTLSTDQAYRIKSDPVLNQVIRDLNLMNGESLDSTDSSDSTAAVQPGISAAHSTLLRDLKGSISVSIVPGTNIVEVSFSSLDPQFAANLVNRVVDDYIQYTVQHRFETRRRASQWPAGQIAKLQDEVQARQRQMMQVQQRLGNTGFNSDYNKAETSLTALIGSAVDARLTRARDEEQYNRLRSLGPGPQANALDSLRLDGLSPLPSLRLQLALARAERAPLAVTLGPNNPQVRTLDAQIASLQASAAAARQRLLDSLRTRFLEARDNQQHTDAALAAALQQTQRNGPDTAEYRELLRQFSLTRLLYTALYTRLRTASIDAGLGAVHIEVLDPARASPQPVPTGAPLTAAILTLSGFLLGCFVSLTLENLRLGLLSVEEVEEVTSLPSLATLPRLDHARPFTPSGPPSSAPPAAQAAPAPGLALTMLSHPGSQFAESIRMLRTNLALSGTGEEPRYILFTSSTPSEGKTTVAGNYALALAESGQPVLLIDADMHRPNIHHRFGFSGHQGLSSILSGTRTLSQCIHRLPGTRHLDVLPAGPVPPAPADLLASPAMLRLLRQACPLYHHIVIDSPPVIAVSDSIILAQLVDAVVYVVRFGKVDRRAIRRGRDLLVQAGAPLAGVVLNGLRPKDSEEWT